MPSYRHSKQENTVVSYPLAGSANKEEINTYMKETKICIFIEMSTYLLITFVYLFTFLLTVSLIILVTAISRIWVR